MVLHTENNVNQEPTKSLLSVIPLLNNRSRADMTVGIAEVQDSHPHQFAKTAHHRDPGKPQPPPDSVLQTRHRRHSQLLSALHGLRNCS